MQDNYTKIDNRFIDEVMQTLKGSEIACCMAIFRKTSGWGKKSAAVSVDVIGKITGITRRPTVMDALHSLEVKGIIKATKTAGKTSVYEFCYHLNQNLETSDEKRTSETENTSTENVTSTRDGKRTSTSDEKRTSLSIYKEKKRKKRETRGDYYDLNKKLIDRHIQRVIYDSATIRNEISFRQKMIRQFKRGDQTTILLFEERLNEYRREEIHSQYFMKPFVVVTSKDRLDGVFISVETGENEKPLVKFQNIDTFKMTEVIFPSFEALEHFLVKGGDR